MTVEVGDVLKSHLGGSWWYLAVESVDYGQRLYHGYLGDDIDDARLRLDIKDESSRGQFTFDEASLQMAAKRSPPKASSSRCSCPWSMLARGCECGAIKQYKLEVGS